MSNNIYQKNFTNEIYSRIVYILTMFIIYRFFTGIATPEDQENSRVTGLILPTSLALGVVSGIIFFYYYIIKNDKNKFLLLSFVFVLQSAGLTLLSGLYSGLGLITAFYNISFWFFVLSAAYYGVRYLKHTELLIRMVLIAYPVLFVQLLLNTGFTGTVVGRNAAYYILFLLPIALLVRTKFVSAISILIATAAIILSYKRTGILSLITSILVYFYLENKRDSNAFSRRLYSFIIFSTVLVGAFVIYGNLSATFGLNWAIRLNTMFESGGSGRTSIYKMIWAALKTQGIKAWIFGNGHIATKVKLGQWAHNDFLEVLYDYGIFGFALYIFMYVALIKEYTNMVRNRYEFYPAFAVSIFLFFWGSMFSQMIIYPFWFLAIALFWGIALADHRNFIEGVQASQLG